MLIAAEQVYWFSYVVIYQEQQWLLLWALV